MTIGGCPITTENFFQWGQYGEGYRGDRFSGYFPAPLVTDTAETSAVPWHLRIEPLLCAVKAEDEDTVEHSRRVAEMAREIGGQLGLFANEIECLNWGSLLHDIGKIAVDPRIKNKPGSLTPEEYRYIRLHAYVGAAMVRPVVGDTIADMIEHHHDHYGGSGHNQMLIGEDIPLGARIIAVADAFDAMVFDRPYRQAITSERAGEEIRQCAGTQFDPEVVKGFVNITGQKSLIGAGII